MMREAERQAIAWCEQQGLDPLEFIPFRFELNDGRSQIRDVPRYFAICGGMIKRSGFKNNCIPVH